MKNLEQIRAGKALTVAERTSKTSVSKLPAMILANGLMATAAFASEKKKDGFSRYCYQKIVKKPFKNASHYRFQESLSIRSYPF